MLRDISIRTNALLSRPFLVSELLAWFFHHLSPLIFEDAVVGKKFVYNVD